VQPLQKEHVIGAVCYRKEGVLLQPLGRHGVECAIHQKQDVGKEYHPYVSGANKQQW